MKERKCVFELFQNSNDEIITQDSLLRDFSGRSLGFVASAFPLAGLRVAAEKAGVFPDDGGAVFHLSANAGVDVESLVLEVVGVFLRSRPRLR